MISAKIIEDSVAPNSVRLTTMQLRYPRFVHAEFMTHRVFSRNASSSRAIPVAKVLKQVREEPATPLHWGANQPGMQANGQVPFETQVEAQAAWLSAAEDAAGWAEKLMELGLHKQVANRLLEPFQFMSVVVTATEWDNFFALRDHPAAEPHMQMLALEMRRAMSQSQPVLRRRERMSHVGWHLPYVLWDERSNLVDPVELAKLSAARCARVSYLNHDGSLPDRAKDLELFERLAGSMPRHASPLEHQAYPLTNPDTESRNFRGWRQFREYIEG